MHVVVVSHQPVPAQGYGGPQRVVAALVRGLAALGQRVTLLAPPGARLPEATVVAVPPRSLNDGAALLPTSRVTRRSCTRTFPCAARPTDSVCPRRSTAT
jgi:hypothetical protein